VIACEYPVAGALTEAALPAQFAAAGITACAAGAWLRVEARGPALAPAALLRAAAALPPRLRYSLAPGGVPRASVDLIFGVDQAAELGRCSAVLAGEKETAGPSATNTPELGAEEFTQLFAEAGQWEFNPRRRGGGSVPLGDGLPPVRVLWAESRLRLVVELPAPENIAPAWREAAAVHLLGVVDTTRLVRAACAETGEPRLEISFFTLPPPVLLGHALGALATAAAQCAGECLALVDPDVARAFLSLVAQPRHSGASASTKTGATNQCHDHA
jgi:hypothetical protein